MSFRCCQRVLGFATFWRVPTPPTRGSANGLATSSATSGAQTVSESTSATRGVDARSQPRRRASRLPGTLVGTIVTEYSDAIAIERSSVTSMTQMTSSTLLSSHDSRARRKVAGSSW
jgi:hypothetical protein